MSPQATPPTDNDGLPASSNIDNMEQQDAAVVYDEDSEEFQIQKRPKYARLTALCLGLLTLAALGFGIYYFLDRNDYSLTKPQVDESVATTVVARKDMALHVEPEDCWMSIHDKVYDMTDYAPLHPGAPSLITNHCGTNATRWFDFEHSVALLPIVDRYMLGTLQLEAVVEEALVAIEVQEDEASESEESVDDESSEEVQEEEEVEEDEPPAVESATEATDTTTPPTVSPTSVSPTSGVPTSSSPTSAVRTLPPATLLPTAAAAAVGTGNTGVAEPIVVSDTFETQKDPTVSTLSPTNTLVVVPDTPPPVTPPPVTAAPITAAPITPPPTQNLVTPQPTNRPTAAPVLAVPVVPVAEPVVPDGSCPMNVYTLADLSQHADEDSCWYGLYGVVYDLTWYIDDHKGGRGTILMDCGKDATFNFVAEKKHDVDMLVKKGFIPSIIGRVGDATGAMYVPCDEVEVPAVTGI